MRPSGVTGYGIVRQKINGIRDILGKDLWDNGISRSDKTGYSVGKSLSFAIQINGIFEPQINGM